MELDKRIKSLSDILTCFDIEKAKQYVDWKGYFAGKLYCFRDIQRCDYGTLSDVCDDQAEVFHMKEYDIHYPFFIPERFLKPTEKKCRPLDLDEFKNRFAIGDVIKLRLKDCSVELCLMYTGNEHQPSEQGDPYCDSVCLGSHSFSMQTLFADYEYYFEVAQKWLPFGVEE